MTQHYAELIPISQPVVPLCAAVGNGGRVVMMRALAINNAGLSHTAAAPVAGIVLPVDLSFPAYQYSSDIWSHGEQQIQGACGRNAGVHNDVFQKSAFSIQQLQLEESAFHSTQSLHPEVRHREEWLRQQRAFLEAPLRSIGPEKRRRTPKAIIQNSGDVFSFAGGSESRCLNSSSSRRNLQLKGRGLRELEEAKNFFRGSPQECSSYQAEQHVGLCKLGSVTQEDKSQPFPACKAVFQPGRIRNVATDLLPSPPAAMQSDQAKVPTAAALRQATQVTSSPLEICISNRDMIGLPWESCANSFENSGVLIGNFLVPVAIRPLAYSDGLASACMPANAPMALQSVTQGQHDDACSKNAQSVTSVEDSPLTQYQSQLQYAGDGAPQMLSPGGRTYVRAAACCPAEVLEQQRRCGLLPREMLVTRGQTARSQGVAPDGLKETQDNAFKSGGQHSTMADSEACFSGDIEGGKSLPSSPASSTPALQGVSQEVLQLDVRFFVRAGSYLQTSTQKFTLPIVRIVGAGSFGRVVAVALDSHGLVAMKYMIASEGDAKQCIQSGFENLVRLETEFCRLAQEKLKAEEMGDFELEKLLADALPDRRAWPYPVGLCSGRLFRLDGSEVAIEGYLMEYIEDASTLFNLLFSRSSTSDLSAGKTLHSLSLTQRVSIALQTARAFAFMERVGIRATDGGPTNILIQQTNQKLDAIPFGNSEPLFPSQKDTDTDTDTAIEEEGLRVVFIDLDNSRSTAPAAASAAVSSGTSRADNPLEALGLDGEFVPAEEFTGHFTPPCMPSELGWLYCLSWLSECGNGSFKKRPNTYSALGLSEDFLIDMWTRRLAQLETWGLVAYVSSGSTSERFVERVPCGDALINESQASAFHTRRFLRQKHPQVSSNAQKSQTGTIEGSPLLAVDCLHKHLRTLESMGALSATSWSTKSSANSPCSQSFPDERRLSWCVPGQVEGNLSTKSQRNPDSRPLHTGCRKAARLRGSGWAGSSAFSALAVDLSQNWREDSSLRAENPTGGKMCDEVSPVGTEAAETWKESRDASGCFSQCDSAFTSRRAPLTPNHDAQYRNAAHVPEPYVFCPTFRDFTPKGLKKWAKHPHRSHMWGVRLTERYMVWIAGMVCAEVLGGPDMVYWINDHEKWQKLGLAEYFNKGNASDFDIEMRRLLEHLVPILLFTKMPDQGPFLKGGRKDFTSLRQVAESLECRALRRPTTPSSRAPRHFDRLKSQDVLFSAHEALEEYSALKSEVSNAGLFREASLRHWHSNLAARSRLQKRSKKSCMFGYTPAERGDPGCFEGFDVVGATDLETAHSLTTNTTQSTIATLTGFSSSAAEAGEPCDCCNSLMTEETYHETVEHDGHDRSFPPEDHNAAYDCLASSANNQSVPVAQKGETYRMASSDSHVLSTTIVHDAAQVAYAAAPDLKVGESLGDPRNVSPALVWSNRPKDRRRRQTRRPYFGKGCPESAVARIEHAFPALQSDVMCPPIPSEGLSVAAAEAFVNVVSILRKALHFDPNMRFANVKEFYSALSSALRSLRANLDIDEA